MGTMGTLCDADTLMVQTEDAMSFFTTTPNAVMPVKDVQHRSQLWSDFYTSNKMRSRCKTGERGGRPGTRAMACLICCGQKCRLAMRSGSRFHEMAGLVHSLCSLRPIVVLRDEFMVVGMLVKTRFRRFRTSSCHQNITDARATLHQLRYASIGRMQLREIYSN